jgi:ATP-dependent Clp protease adaptor protein ClpS
LIGSSGFPIVLRELGTRHAFPQRFNPVESVAPPSELMIPPRYDEEAMATIASPGTRQENLNQQVPFYNVVLLDDAEHTYDYVVEMLEKLFALSESDAWNRAVEVDTTGRTIVITCELPAAEFGRDQIHAFGADWRMPVSKGSMSAIVEPCRET